MLVEDVFAFLRELQDKRGLTEDELVMAMMAFTWCNKEKFEQLLDLVERMEK